MGLDNPCLLNGKNIMTRYEKQNKIKIGDIVSIVNDIGKIRTIYMSSAIRKRGFKNWKVLFLNPDISCHSYFEAYKNIYGLEKWVRIRRVEDIYGVSFFVPISLIEKQS